MNNETIVFRPGFIRLFGAVVLSVFMPAFLLGPTFLEWSKSGELLVEVVSRGDPVLIALGLIFIFVPWLWFYISYDTVILTLDSICVTNRIFGLPSDKLVIRYDDVISFQKATDDESTFEKHIINFKGVLRWTGGMVKLTLRDGKSVQFDIGFLDQKRFFHELHDRVYR